jgi:hypothetical protein
MSCNNLQESLKPVGRLRLERDDDLPDGRGAHYSVILRFEGKEYTSSLECADGEGAVEDIELTETENRAVSNWMDLLY